MTEPNPPVVRNPEIMKLSLFAACLVACPAWIFAQAPVAGPGAKPITHKFLKSGCGSHGPAIVDVDGKILWQYAIEDETNDAWALPGGSVIFAYHDGVREVAADAKTIVWEYKAAAGGEIHSCQPLPGELFLISEAHNQVGYLYEMDRKGVAHKTITIHGGGDAHANFRQVRKTAKGTYLVSFLYSTKTVVEYDADGKVVHDFKQGQYVGVRLPNGNTLLSCAEEHRVVEVDPADKVVWEVKENDLPGCKLAFVASVQRLPNGNTVIANWTGHGGGEVPQAVEVTPEKKIVWKVQDPRLGMISNLQILDVPGDATKFTILR